MEECLHGMQLEWCGICLRTPGVGEARLGSYGYHGGETKQDVLDDITELLGLPASTVSVGSSLPSEVFVAAAQRLGLGIGSMPEICEAIVRSAGHSWSPGFDSRGSLSGGGSTVTLEGIRAMREALRALL